MWSNFVVIFQTIILDTATVAPGGTGVFLMDYTSMSLPAEQYNFFQLFIKALKCSRWNETLKNAIQERNTVC